MTEIVGYILKIPFPLQSTNCCQICVMSKTKSLLGCICGQFHVGHICRMSGTKGIHETVRTHGTEGTLHMEG